MDWLNTDEDDEDKMMILDDAELTNLRSAGGAGASIAKSKSSNSNSTEGNGHVE